MGHFNSCLGKPFVHEGTTAIPKTVEGHHSKLCIYSHSTSYIFLKDEREGAGLVCPLLWELYQTVFSSKDLADNIDKITW